MEHDAIDELYPSSLIMGASPTALLGQHISMLLPCIRWGAWGIRGGLLRQQPPALLTTATRRQPGHSG